MKYYKIVNFLDNSVAQYKGLNISFFVAGGQHIDWDNNSCVISTNEVSKISHPDLIELTESQYNEIREAVSSEGSGDSSDPVSEIQALNDKVDSAILELTTLIAMGGMMDV